MDNLKLYKSVHIIVIQAASTSQVEYYSLPFYILMTLLCACVKKDEEHLFRATVKQSQMSIHKILAAQL